MTKNNLKVVKSDNKKTQEIKEKNKSLEAAISQIDQNFGKGSVMRLGQQEALDVEAISTGSLSLDLALGMTQKHPLLQSQDEPFSHTS